MLGLMDVLQGCLPHTHIPCNQQTCILSLHENGLGQKYDDQCKRLHVTKSWLLIQIANQLLIEVLTGQWFMWDQWSGG